MIRFGTSGEYPPFEYYEADQLQGFDIELGHLIAKRMGKKAVFENMDFSAILPAIANGLVDGGLSAISITPGRQKNFDFSSSYYSGRLALIFRKGEEPPEDLSAHKMACQLGSTMEEWAKKHLPQAPLTLMNDNTQIIEALRSGHVDGVLMGEVESSFFVQKNSSLSCRVLGQTGEHLGIIFRKGSPLVKDAERALQSLKQDGSLLALEKKWLMPRKKLSLGSSLFSQFLFVGKGLGVTMVTLLGALTLGFLLGTLLAILRHQQILPWIWDGLVSVVRGTPLILQVSLIFFLLPRVLGFKLSAMESGIVAFGLNSSAYIAETLKGGIQSLAKEQFQAARALHISPYFMWKDIILPQVLRNIFPSLINEVIALLKETSLISIFGGLDLMRKAQLLIVQESTYFIPLCIAAAYYYGLVLLIEWMGRKVPWRRVT